MSTLRTAYALRTRWSAIGAAVAISLGAGGLGLAEAALGSGGKPVTVTITPTRILDTRTDLGLTGRFTDAAPRELAVTGVVPVAPSGAATVVPVDASGLLVNVTVVRPTHAGFLALRPGGATGEPTTSTVNFFPGTIEPNAASVDIGPAGTVQIWVETASDSGTAHVLLDIVGYTIDHTHDDRYYTQSDVYTLIAAIPAGPPGPAGADGVDGQDGVDGVDGADGADGADAPRPAQVVWVATSGGDHTKLSSALAAIDDASAGKPYVIKIAPGVYTETAPVDVKDFVDIEGSGQEVTTLTCACGGTFPPIRPFVQAGMVTAEVRNLTIENTGGGEDSTAILTTGPTIGSFSLLNITAIATGGTTNNRGVMISSSQPTLTNVTATAIGGSTSRGVSSVGTSSPTLTNVTAVASGATTNIGLQFDDSSPTIRNSSSAGASISLYVNDSTTKVSDTMLDGPVDVFGGTIACVGAHTAAFVELSASCT